MRKLSTNDLDRVNGQLGLNALRTTADTGSVSGEFLLIAVNLLIGEKFVSRLKNELT
jgi:hypothetical protein